MPPATYTNSPKPQNRLHHISAQMATIRPTAFRSDAVPQAPEDPLFGLMAAYRKDTSDKKVDLGIGAYRDDNAKPWVLPVVKQVCENENMAGFVKLPLTKVFAGGPETTRRSRPQPRVPPHRWPSRFYHGISEIDPWSRQSYTQRTTCRSSNYPQYIFPS